MENPIIMLLFCGFLLYKATKIVFLEEEKLNKKNLKTYRFLENKKSA